jgi:hypothetical protein
MEIDMSIFQKQAKNFVCKEVDEMNLDELRIEFRKLEKITSDWINKCAAMENEIEKLRNRRIDSIQN